MGIFYRCTKAVEKITDEDKKVFVFDADGIMCKVI